MSRWFRFYEGALDDPKVQRLPAQVFKGWVNILCLASKSKGRLPSLPDIAFALRISEHEADTLIQALMAAGLVDDIGDGMQPHKWYERQFDDPTNADRQKRFRERKKEERAVTRYGSVTPVTDNGHVTPLEQNREEQNRTEEMRAKARAVIPQKLVFPREKLVFPRDGWLDYSPFAEVARKAAPGVDINLLASAFRKFCHERDIDFASPGIEKTFATFCQKHRSHVA